MNMCSTFANGRVLDFYRELPFNYSDSVEEQADAVKLRNSVLSYPVLADLLRPQTSILEIGCGTGWLSHSIAYHYGLKVHAIDFNPVAIERAVAVGKRLDVGATFEVADLFLFRPMKPAEVAVSIGVLHHTNDCHEAIRRVIEGCVTPGGYAFVGLYHAPGRRPFLEHFAQMRREGANEEELFARYRELVPYMTDRTQARSWFRDQVLHPHETSHTLAEMLPLLRECRAELVSTSINRFEPIKDLASVLAEERSYEEISTQWLRENRYFPGFFSFLAKKRLD